uniref:NHL repeat containing 3 n=1 Tax=Pipistrellus kuhlii TaxID=59472 RepID=A0A7J7ZL32_PIPKU|nr:NHL repeat containing 3 [Pipistrellus kuhlii]
MARFWLCAAATVFFLAFAILYSRFSGSLVLREFIFHISWRTEKILYRLDVGWPKHSEYFTGATFCVAVDSLNGLLYIAQDPLAILLKNIIPLVILFKSWVPQAKKALV